MLDGRWCKRRCWVIGHTSNEWRGTAVTALPTRTLTGLTDGANGRLTASLLRRSIRISSAGRQPITRTGAIDEHRDDAMRRDQRDRLRRRLPSSGQPSPDTRSSARPTAGTAGSAISALSSRAEHEMILIQSDAAPIQTEAPTHHRTNPVHIDITPNDGVDAAIEQILELGGSVKKPPSLYPRPGSHGDDAPVIDWAVMQRPVRQRVLPRPRPHPRAVRRGHARRRTRSHQRRSASRRRRPDRSHRHSRRLT